MKIESNTTYHIPTKAHEDNFLKQAEMQGFNWISGSKPTSKSYWEFQKEDYTITTELRDFFRGFLSSIKSRNPEPIVEWEIGFTKSDMQIGQRYKIRNGESYIWEEGDASYYNDNLCHVTFNDHHEELDIIEVYEMTVLPIIWKREEPKYRVKTELTKEQAEKLGLELYEVTE